MHSLVYIAAIPIWNFVLPIYSFWHFDDFSWGETRRIDGGDLNSNKVRQVEEEANKVFLETGTYNIQRKLWHIWEKERKSNPEKEKSKRLFVSESTAVQKTTREIHNSVTVALIQSPSQQPLHLNFNRNRDDRLNYSQYLHPFRYNTNITPQFMHPPQIPALPVRYPHHFITDQSPHALYQQQQQQQFLERQQQYIVHQQQHHYIV